MNLDRKTFQIPGDHQRQFQIFSRSSETLVIHAKDDFSLWNQSTDSSKDSTRRFFVSPSEGSRTSRNLASLRLSGTLAESTLSGKAKGAGEMMVRFPTTRRLSLTGSAFSRELRANSPCLRSILVVKSVSNQELEKIHQLTHQTSRPADAETGFGMDDKRTGVFCDGATTVPEGNNGTKEGAMVF